MQVTVEKDVLNFKDVLSINFQRTLRIPDNDDNHSLPPGMGTFPIFRVEDYADTVPSHWLGQGGVFIPMYQREALWISFQAKQASAVKVAAGMINAVSGKTWNDALLDQEQDYLAVPPQPWLDGFNTGNGIIRQFVATPLGQGQTVEGQVTGEEKFGGLQIKVFASKNPTPIRPRISTFVNNAIPSLYSSLHTPSWGATSMSMNAPTSYACCDAPVSKGFASKGMSLRGAVEMGMAAGGKMTQDISPDTHGYDTWSQDNTGRVFVHIVNSEMFKQITGKEPPASPITAETYTRRGWKWFSYYNEHGDIAPSTVLAGVKSLAELEDNPDPSLKVPSVQIQNISSNKVSHGIWT